MARGSFAGSIGRSPCLRNGSHESHPSSRTPWRAKPTDAVRADRDMTTTIVIADDHAAVRQVVRLLIDGEEDLRVVAEAGTVPDAERLTYAHRPTVLVLDLNMPGGSSLEAIPRLLTQAPATAIVVLTMQDDPAFARQALRAGALGYVLKEAADEELRVAIRLAAAGDTYLGPGLAAHLAAGLSRSGASSTARGRCLVRLDEALDLARPVGVHGDCDVTATLEDTQPATRDQSRGLGEELGAVEAIRASREDQRGRSNRALAARQVEGVFSLDRRGHIRQIISAGEQARTGEPREGRGGELPASGRNDAGHHHGERLPLGATPDASGHPALEDAPVRTEPAGGAENHEATDDIRVIGSQLLGDAPAG